VNHQIKVRKLLDESGLDWGANGEGRVPIMHMLSQHFESNHMKKVFRALLEMGIAK